jgi:hypothetical protein
MSTNSPSPAGPGERIALRLIVETVPDADAQGVILPDGPSLLDDDLAHAVQAARDAFEGALSGTRTVVSSQYRLAVVADDVPNPAADTEF